SGRAKASTGRGHSHRTHRAHPVDGSRIQSTCRSHGRLITRGRGGSTSAASAPSIAEPGSKRATARALPKTGTVVPHGCAGWLKGTTLCSVRRNGSREFPRKGNV